MRVVVTFDLAPELVARIRAVDPSLDVRTLGAGTWQLFAGRVPYPSEVQMAVDPAEIPAALADAEVIMSSWAGSMPALNLPEVAPNLRWAQLTHAGVERIDWTRTGDVTFTTVGGMSAGPIAEWVIGCMLMFAKGWPQAFRNQQGHAYARYMPREVAGTTVGIIGLGTIGSEVATRARALGCRVIATRRSYTAGAIDPLVDEALPTSEMHRLLAESDYVVLTAPLTPETRGLINAAALASMRSHAVLLNVGRGPLIEEAALVTGLREGQIAGAALDVFDVEPLPEGSPLWDLERLLLTPHVAAGTDRYHERATDIFCANLKRFLTGQPLENTVDSNKGY